MSKSTIFSHSTRSSFQPKKSVGKTPFFSEKSVGFLVHYHNTPMKEEQPKKGLCEREIPVANVHKDVGANGFERTFHQREDMRCDFKNSEELLDAVLPAEERWFPQGLSKHARCQMCLFDTGVETRDADGWGQRALKAKMTFDTRTLLHPPSFGSMRAWFDSCRVDAGPDYSKLTPSMERSLNDYCQMSYRMVWDRCSKFTSFQKLEEHAIAHNPVLFDTYLTHDGRTMVDRVLPDYTTWTVRSLKEQLKKARFPLNGKKADLVARMVELWMATHGYAEAKRVQSIWLTLNLRDFWNVLRPLPVGAVLYQGVGKVERHFSDITIGTWGKLVTPMSTSYNPWAALTFVSSFNTLVEVEKTVLDGKGAFGYTHKEEEIREKRVLIVYVVGGRNVRGIPVPQLMIRGDAPSKDENGKVRDFEYSATYPCSEGEVLLQPYLCYEVINARRTNLYIPPCLGRFRMDGGLIEGYPLMDVHVVVVRITNP